MPGFIPIVVRKSLTAFGICPQDCAMMPLNGGSPGSSCRPEYAHSDLPFNGASGLPAIHLPLPVISPATAAFVPMTQAAQRMRAANFLFIVLSEEFPRSADHTPNARQTRKRLVTTRNPKRI